MVNYSTELGSVHLSETDLCNLESRLKSLSESSEAVFQIRSNGFPVIESSSKDLTQHNFIEDNSLAYDIRYSCTEGKLRIVANSTESESHQLFVDGNEEWVEKAVQQITSFMDLRKNTWRSYVSRRGLICLDVVFAIALSNSLGLFLPSKMLFPRITILDYITLFVSAAGLLTIHQRNRVYPYFSVVVDEKSPYPKLSPLLLPLIFLIGFVTAATLNVP